MVRGWYQCCCGLNGFLGWGGGVPLVSPTPPRGGSVTTGRDGSSCLSCLTPRLGWGVGGFSEAFEALGSTRERRRTCLLVRDPGAKAPPPGHCMTGAFLVFLVQLLNVQCVM